MSALMTQTGATNQPSLLQVAGLAASRRYDDEDGDEDDAYRRKDWLQLISGIHFVCKPRLASSVLVFAGKLAPICQITRPYFEHNTTQHKTSDLTCLINSSC